MFGNEILTYFGKSRSDKTAQAALLALVIATITVVVFSQPLIAKESVYEKGCDRRTGHRFDAGQLAYDPVPHDVLKRDVEKNVDTLIGLCAKAAERNPDKPRYLFQLGRIKFAAGRVNEAIEHYKAAAEAGHMNARFWLAFYEMRGLHGFKKQTFVAEMKLKGLAKHKQFGPAYVALGQHHFSSKKYEEAFQYLSDAEKIGEKTGCYLLAQMYERGLHVEKNGVKAMAHYETCVKVGHLVNKSSWRLVFFNNAKAKLRFNGESPDKFHFRALDNLKIFFESLNGKSLSQQNYNSVLRVVGEAYLSGLQRSFARTKFGGYAETPWSEEKLGRLRGDIAKLSIMRAEHFPKYEPAIVSADQLNGVSQKVVEIGTSVLDAYHDTKKEKHNYWTGFGDPHSHCLSASEYPLDKIKPRMAASGERPTFKIHNICGLPMRVKTLAIYRYPGSKKVEKTVKVEATIAPLSAKTFGFEKVGQKRHIELHYMACLDNLGFKNRNWRTMKWQCHSPDLSNNEKYQAAKAELKTMLGL